MSLSEWTLTSTKNHDSISTGNESRTFDKNLIKLQKVKPPKNPVNY